MGHCYYLPCKGRNVRGLCADISGTLLGLREDCEEVFGREIREAIAKEKAKKAEAKKQAAFDEVARAYNRGEGFIQMAPALGLVWFSYNGRDWNLDAVAERAREIRYE